MSDKHEVSFEHLVVVTNMKLVGNGQTSVQLTGPAFGGDFIIDQINDSEIYKALVNEYNRGGLVTIKLCVTGDGSIGTMP